MAQRERAETALALARARMARRVRALMVLPRLVRVLARARMAQRMRAMN
jgi:hypothetical protein